MPPDLPLRAIQRHVDAVLLKRSPLLDALYERDGRPSIPAEPRLKARVLTALDSVRRKRLFGEQLGYNLLWPRFLDREWREGSFDHSVFAKNCPRMLSADVARRCLAEDYELSRQQDWTSDEPFTADGSPIESLASLKRFVCKDGADARKVASAHASLDDNGSSERRSSEKHHFFNSLLAGPGADREVGGTSDPEVRAR
ncbi:MAG: hypothetical protein IPM17_17250 [Verrucomicrobia bacterium]|nr:hypothetical protein [Verrucomicrobiota bacterium]